MRVTNENIEPGFIVSNSDAQKFLILKVNQKSFYAVPISDKSDKRTLLDKFQTKPKSYKIDDYCRDTGTISANYSDNYILCPKEEYIISNKVIKEKKMGVSPCCGQAAVKSFKRRKQTGRTQCRACGKPLNTIKLEPDDWLSFSQEMALYQVNLTTGDIRKIQLKEGENGEKKTIVVVAS